MAEKHLQKSWKIRFRISCHETVVKKQNLSYHSNRPNICIENYTFGGNGRVEEEERILPIFIAFFLGLLFPHLIFLPWRMWRHTHLFSKRQQQCWKPQNVLTEILQYSLSWSYSKWDMGKNPQVFSAKPQPNLDTHTNFPSKITFQSLFCVNTELMVSHPNSSDGFDENPNQDFFLNSWNWGENGSTLTFMRKITYAHFFFLERSKKLWSHLLTTDFVGEKANSWRWNLLWKNKDHK